MSLAPPHAGTTGGSPPIGSGAPVGLPRLLPAAGERLDDLAAHLARHGALPVLAPVRRGHHPPAGPSLIGMVERAGLRGRGGSGFPTARKLAAVAAQRGPAVVLVNAVEAEPVSAKDKALCTLAPHLVLDGASLAAEAVRANRIVVVAHPSIAAVLGGAARARAAHGIDPVAIEIVPAADHFVAGEESAVVNWVDHGRSVPTSGPHRPYERGVGRRPTLVNNAETMAHVALIARYGDEWYRTLGTPDEPGTMLVTARGAVGRPGVYEAAIGTPLDDVVRATGGAVGAPGAFLVGGYFGTWLPATAAHLPLSRAGLVSSGASVGAGLVLVMPSACCGVVETARLARYLAGQSAGQCGPCVFGLRAIGDEIARLARCESTSEGRGNLRRWLGQVEGRGGCAQPDGAVRLVRSGLAVFADEVGRHASGRCSAAHPEQSALGLPGVRQL